ncbi:MAG: response regulator receiver modulated diguanylate cyclase/phosphodiesterase [Gemmatimonadetes bacterium]|jgi:diguanylate cyclase (GGDEF)-like protein|nr:response regulator receiver modulated diguanylate cyclase/phosphodiesterase [Gemmatimonadota bacterium]
MIGTPAGESANPIEFLLGVPPEESYDRMARLVAASLHAPMAIVTVSEMGRQVVRGCVGVAGRARAWRTVPNARVLVQRAIADVQHAVLDATHPIEGVEARRGVPVEQPPHVIAVVPFVCRDRRTTGAVCVADPDSARAWTQDELLLLADLAEAMCTELDLRREVVIRRDTQEALVHITLHDELTGLPNRAYLSERLRNAITRAQRDPTSQFAVLFLDLDRFKIVNDSIGHHGGDGMLVAVAERLAGVLRPEDTVARMGGDEFAILLEGLSGSDDARIVAERIQIALSRPIDLGGYEVYTSASIGIVLSSSSFLATEHPEHLLRNADMAMYRAKSGGPAGHALFDRAMHRDALARLQLETDLRHALERGEFRLVYQPVISLRTGRIVGAEALIRWQHPERGLVPPSEFVPLAEDTGLIVPIGEWVLHEACSRVQRWATPAGTEPLTLAVNLSIKQFAKPGLDDRLAVVLKDTGLAPERLALEVTESIVIDQPEATTVLLASLKGLGVKVHMDDFGTGYSSLSYLHQLPLDGLKVDRAFVSRMDHDERSRQLVHTVLQLARSIGLVAVAEGVTTRAQLTELRRLDCEFGQGYLFSEPLEPDAFGALIATGPHW